MAGEAGRYSLVELGRGVFAWVDGDRRFGSSNVGLVIDGDGLTVIDTTATPARGAAVRQEIEALTGELGLPVKRVVYTSSRIAFVGGSRSFWPSAFYATDPVSDALDLPADPEIFRRLLPDLADDYPDELVTEPASHTVSERAWLTPAVELMPLPGEGPANLVALVPAAGVAFAGALASFGVTPLGLEADPAAWITSLGLLAEAAPTIVPGHGPPGGTADLGDLAGYLAACIEARGDVGALRPGPWSRWADQRFHPVNVERAARLARGDAGVPEAMLRLLGLV